MHGLFVMGAGGRVGRLLRGVWAQAPVRWQSRAGADVAWSLDDGTAALARAMQGAEVVLCLAGATPGAADFSLNVRLAEAAVRAAAQAKCRRVLLTSTLAVYGGGAGPHSERDTCAPQAPYGASKLEMEAACLPLGAEMGVQVSALRLGNIVGADMLFANLAAGRAITLDQFADGRTPARSYLDPRALAAVVARLAEAPEVPTVLNVAADPPAEMGALLDVAGIPWTPRPAPPWALPRVKMDLSQLAALMPVPSGHPEVLAAGWRAAL